jgi:hypothetical protein
MCHARQGWAAPRRTVQPMAAQRGIRRMARSVAGLLRGPGRSVASRSVASRSGSARSGSARPAGAPDVRYRPRKDGAADPGEVVWAWVPFDEGDGRGKDRPVLVIGRRGPHLLALMLSSQDHDLDAADEARHGRLWTDIGTGAWDARSRPSEVRLDRLLVLDPASVRREGATLDRARFERVVAEAGRVQGW